MKKIMVPTDFSPIAELGFKLALEIAKRCEASIQLVNFTRSSITAVDDAPMTGFEEENLKSGDSFQAIKIKMDNYVQQFAQEGIVINPIIDDHGFKQGIDQYPQKQEFDLIVMGTSGEESGEEIFTGNHTQQVIKVSNCPVLSVREGFSIDHLKSMVVAVDVISDNQVALGLRTLRKLATCFDAHIHLVHILQRTENSFLLKAYFTNLAHASELQNFSIHILEANDEPERVIMYARQVRAGLIAVLKNSKNGLFNFFADHFSDRVVKEVGRPVFTVNLQNAS